VISTNAEAATRIEPRVVALGGGYGLSTALRAIRRYSSEVAGIVSVADDGGSSGRLRRAFGIPAPGDVRRCIGALSDPSSTWAKTLEHRFDSSELEGHPVGNIVLAGLAEVLGDFSMAIDEAMRLSGGVGRLLPATIDSVELKAAFRSIDRELQMVEGEVHGEAAVGQTGGITTLTLVPDNPAVHPDAVRLIEAADQILIGPGSLYTSTLAVLCVPAINAAVRGASGRKIYVANLGEQHPETTGYDIARHIEALREHGVEVDFVVRDPAGLALGHVSGPTIVDWPIAGPNGKLHAPERLAEVLVQLLPATFR
jgi:uncharacterized cofD-like protein